MRIVVRAHNISVATQLRTHVERALALAFDHLRFQIRQVTLRVSDVNGPKGGEDKRCSLEIQMRHGGSVFVQDQAFDIRSGIDRIVGRASRALGKIVARERDILTSKVELEAWRTAS